MDTWNRYKEMCKLTNLSTICNELRMACTPELNRLLFNLMGAEALNMASEDQLLQYIKLIAVRGFYKEVHQQNFHSMKQKEGELITHFLARLWTLAKFCEFTVACSNKPDCGRCVDYSNNMVAGQIVAGLANMDHQTKILVEAITLVTLQQNFDRLVSLEMTDHSTPPCTILRWLTCKGRTARSSPEKLRPHQPHNMSNPAEDVESIHIPTGQ